MLYWWWPWMYVFVVFFLFFFCVFFFVFFFNDTATTEIYTLSLHDALPISPPEEAKAQSKTCQLTSPLTTTSHRRSSTPNSLTSRKKCSSRSTREPGHHLGWQARLPQIGRAHVWTPVTVPYLVCRLLLEKKKKTKKTTKKKKKKRIDRYTNNNTAVSL